MNQMWHLFQKNCSAAPERPALESQDSVISRYSLKARIESLRCTLHQVCPHEPLFLLCDNNLYCIQTLLSALCGSNQLVLLDASLPPQTLIAQMQAVGTGTLLYSELQQQLARKLCADKRRSIALEALLYRRAKYIPLPEIEEDTPAMLMFPDDSLDTYITLSRKSILIALERFAEMENLCGSDRTAALAPLHQLFGIINGLLLPLYCGGTVYLVQGLQKLVAQFKRHEVTSLLLAPGLARLLLKDFEATNTPLPHIRTAYCCNMPQEIGAGLTTHGIQLTYVDNAAVYNDLATAEPLIPQREGTVIKVLPRVRPRSSKEGVLRIPSDAAVSG